MKNSMDLINIKDASVWATKLLGKKVTPSNISYLIQYGRIHKYNSNGNVLVSIKELSKYYKSYNGYRAETWREKLGSDLNWALSFDQYKEAETTKHVHRLHPYKGKFIPQLVEYFLDQHKDKFKKQSFFNPGDIILDPFCGSGTTLVQACELGMHAIGIDVSAFNALISNVKVDTYDLVEVKHAIDHITRTLESFLLSTRTYAFEEELLNALYQYNSKYFPVPKYKYQLKRHEIDEEKYGTEKERNFQPTYYKLVNKYNIKLRQKKSDSFLDKWFSQHIRDEIDIAYKKIQKISDPKVKNIISVIVSRTIRSCRATTHSDLATLIEPVTAPYYCSKHGKICKPLFSILKWWKTYSTDTLKRLHVFNKLRTDTFQYCLTGDSRTINIYHEIGRISHDFSRLLATQKIAGIFSSPPYVGLIDYHEQHAYAYDLFQFERRDTLEIGPLFKGQGKEAKESYIIGISEVLQNCREYLADNYNVFLVANDKHNLYPIITEKAGMKIVNQYRRPVLNRTERDKGAYSETIFHLRSN